MLALVQGFSPLGRGKSHRIEHETKRGKKSIFAWEVVQGEIIKFGFCQ